MVSSIEEKIWEMLRKLLKKNALSNLPSPKSRVGTNYEWPNLLFLEFFGNGFLSSTVEKSQSEMITYVVRWRQNHSIFSGLLYMIAPNSDVAKRIINSFDEISCGQSSFCDMTIGYVAYLQLKIGQDSVRMDSDTRILLTSKHHPQPKRKAANVHPCCLGLLLQPDDDGSSSFP